MISRKTGLYVLAFALGFFSLGAQTLLFREHLIAYSGNELGTGAFFAAWMFWIAAGALVGRWLAMVGCSRALGWVVAVYPVVLLLGLELFWRMRGIAGVGPTDLFPLESLLGWTLILGAPVSFVTGVLFTVISVRVKEELGGAVGSAILAVYGLEALGSFAGGVVVTLFQHIGVPFAWQLGVYAGLWECAALIFCVGTGMQSGDGSRQRRAWASPVFHGVLLLGLVLAFVSGGAGALHKGRLKALHLPREFYLVEQVDTPYRTVAAARLGAVTAFFSDGEMVTALPGDVAELESTASMLAMNPAARRALVLGFGAEALLCELARSPLQSITYVGIDRTFLEVVDRNMPKEVKECVRGGKVSVVYDDAREFLRRQDENYDLVVLALGEPTTARSSRFFTLEFFELVRSRLSAGGVFSLEITTAENALVKEALLYAATVHSTLSLVFDKVAMNSLGKMRFFAGGKDSRVTADPSLLKEQFAGLISAMPEFPPERFDTLFESARINALVETFNRLTPRLVSRDSAPSVFLLNLLAVHHDSRLAGFLRTSRRNVGPWAIALLLAFFLSLLLAGGGSRRTKAVANRQARPQFSLLLITAAGFGGMAGQVVILLAWQARFGSVFLLFGLLNALFMLGLFLGTVSSGRVKALGSIAEAAAPFALCAMLFVNVVLIAVGQVSAPALAAMFFAASLMLGGATGLCLSIGAYGSTAAISPDGSRAVPQHMTDALLPSDQQFSSTGPDDLGERGCACVPDYTRTTGLCQGGGAHNHSFKDGKERDLATARAAYKLEICDHLGAVAGALLSGLVLIPAVGMQATLMLVALGAGGAAGLRMLYVTTGWPGVDRPGTVPCRPVRVALFLALLLVVASGLIPSTAEEKESAFHGASISPSVGGEEGTRLQADERQGTVVGRTSVSGYGGPMEVVVTLDASGRVQETRLGAHNETPEYIFDIDDWLDGLRGKRGSKLVYDGEGPEAVDAYTGATVTGKAVVEAVKKIASKHDHDVQADSPKRTFPSGAAGQDRPAPEVQGGAQDEEGDRAVTWWSKVWNVVAASGAAIALAFILGFGLLLYFVRSRLITTVYLGVLVIFAGALWNKQVALDTLAQAFSGNLPPFGNLSLWVMLGALAIGLVLGGPIFCGYMCPFGAFLELLSRVGLAWKVPPAMDRRLRNLKYLVGAAVLFLFVATSSRVFFSFDPLMYAFSRRWDAVGAAILAMIVASSLIWYRPWCRYLCPTGACLSLSERLAPRFPRSVKRNSARCHLGVAVGRDWDCLRCNRCVDGEPIVSRGRMPRVSGVMVLVFVTLVGIGGVYRLSWSSRSGGSVKFSKLERLDSGAVGQLGGTAGADRTVGADGKVGADERVEAEGTNEVEPMVHRKDDKAYEFQKNYDPAVLRRWMRTGTISDKEAEFWVPVK